jgi:hypothetical protein
MFGGTKPKGRKSITEKKHGNRIRTNTELSIRVQKVGCIGGAVKISNLKGKTVRGIYIKYHSVKVYGNVEI